MTRATFLPGELGIVMLDMSRSRALGSDGETSSQCGLEISFTENRSILRLPHEFRDRVLFG